jgi:peptidoglycan hydrolase-like protein with peptidoglycan-binding domain
MLLVGKAACSGIVFLLLTTGISGPRSTSLASRPKLSAEVPGIAPPDNVIRMQQALQDKGCYHGKLDGVFGLRTRAGIRAYQKAENLPVTGQVDTQTAAKLRLTAEVRDENVSATMQAKPSAGLKWIEGSRRRSNLPRKTVTRNGNGTVPPA